MKVDVEVISPIEKKLNVELPVDLVDAALSAQYKQLSKTARVKGFRPGKIPMGLLRKMFRPQAQSGALQALIQSNLEPALREGDITPLNFPDIDRDELVEGQPFTFSLRCQVKPEIVIEGMDKIVVDRKPVEVADEAVNEQIEQLRTQHAELEPVESQPADTGHHLTIDYVGRLKGEEEPFEGGTGNDHSLELGSGQLVPGFEDQLIGANEGDVVKVELSFPEDYTPALAGKEAIFDVTVKSIKQKVLADVDDDFAVDLGHDDLGALRAKLYDDLYQRQRQESDADVRESIIKSLIEHNPVEIPSSLVSMAEDQLRQQLGMHLAMSGMPREQLAQALEAEKDNLTQRASELAHRDLLLEAVAEKAELDVSEDELDEKLADMAAGANQPKAKVRATLQQNNRLEALRAEILQEKTLKWLEENAGNDNSDVQDSTASSESGKQEDDTEESEDE